MKCLFIQYPLCSTCRKAKKWLDDQGVQYEARHIVEENPTREELEKWTSRSGLPLKSFFNTHGVLYREFNLKDKLDQMSIEEQLDLLSSDGKLIKRPLVVGNDFVLVGFDPNLWAEKLK